MKNSMEMFSPGEISFYVTRAAVGVGVPFGIAEDFANSLIWSQPMGIDLAQLALDSLNALDSNPGSGRISIFQKGLNQIFTGRSGLSAVFAGPSLSDFWQISTGKDCTLIGRAVDFPILVAGAFVKAGSRPALLEWENVRFTLYANGAIDLMVTDDMALKNVGPFDVLIRKPEKETGTIEALHFNTNNLDRMAQKALNHGIYINKEAWTGILSLFKRSLIPSSNQSLNTGAGAGLVDND